MKKPSVIILFAFAVVVNLCATAYSQFVTESPDKKISIGFMLDNNGTPIYNVTANQTTFIGWSKLGLNFRDGFLGSGMALINTEQKTIDETYQIVAGKSSSSRNYCIETKITLRESGATQRTLELYFRAYNDGVAFRYGMPAQNKGELVLSNEETYFNFAGNYQNWAFQTASFSNFSYEGDFKNATTSSLVNSNNLTSLPLTVRVNQNLYVCLSEANITNYPGMYLTSSGSANSFKSRLATNPNDNSTSAVLRTPFVTPWRMFIIGKKAGSLIESNLVMNLNEPLAIDASWIKPGKSVWDWWSGSAGFDANFGFGMNAKTFMYYIDFAAANNIEYVTVDAGWYGNVDAFRSDQRNDITKSIPEINIESLASYANSKGVGLMVWILWYQLRDQIDEAMAYYERIGIKGIKIDFMNRDDQEMVNFYHTVLQKASAHKLLVNFHGAYKPDGLNRTYPNLITREAVLGAEYSKWDQNLPNPTYNVTLPFTRMVVGAMDYTPGGMRNSAPNDKTVNGPLPIARGTRAHNLAMLVVFESPVQTLCESPAVYQNSAGFDFIKECPTTWDETKVLSGKIREYIVIARKKNNKWYIGAMTNTSGRSIKINYSFLGGGEYSSRIYMDTPETVVNPNNVGIITDNISSGDTEEYVLMPGGGLAMILTRR